MNIGGGRRLTGLAARNPQHCSRKSDRELLQGDFGNKLFRSTQSLSHDFESATAK
jgi:hypothetical protein